MFLLLTFAAVSSPALAVAAEPSQSMAPSAQIDMPPSQSKLVLIRRFLRAIGLQQKLDSGSFLERYAIPGGAMWDGANGQNPKDTFKEGFCGSFRSALV